MGCVASKPLPPAEASKVVVQASAVTIEPIHESSPDPQEDKPPAELLLKLAMGADTNKEKKDKVTSNRDNEPENVVNDGSNTSPIKSRVQQAILGDPQPEEGVPFMLPDVSYSMRGSLSQSADPKEAVNQVNVSPTRKVQGPPPMPSRQPSLNGVREGQLPLLVPLQQPQVARAPGWVAVPQGRGRGGPIGAAPPGYRGPLQPVHVPGPRGSIPAARGRGVPIQVMVLRDQSPTHGGQRQQFPVAGKYPSADKDGSPFESHAAKAESRKEKNDDDTSGESDGDNEDIDDDDAEAEDWDLGDGGGANEASKSAAPHKPQSSQQHQVAPEQAPRRSSGFKPKFRPALDLADDAEAVNSDISSDESDDDDAVDEVHDWLDIPATHPVQTPTQSPIRMSPTRNAPANLHIAITPTHSPVKQASYRSGIVSNVASGVAPLVMVGDRSPVRSAPSPGPSSPTAAIRDTKVVKKKKAELPQHNLPHPVPKFGDWLNSRTMINNYIILESLGTGGYAEVKLCKEKQSGALFAMKFISRDVMKKDKLGKQSKLDDIKREIAIMKKLNHPNVLRLYEVMDDPKMNKLFLVLEYMKHGDMLSYQKKKHPEGMLENLRDRDLHSVFLQVILGLAYLHEQKIVHGDIKPQNLLVGEKDVVKIADFGISQSLYGSKQKITDVAGTPAFMSPEMCSGEEYSGQLADIWALGATVFMLKFGNPPFLAKSALQMFERIQNDPLVFPGPIDPLLAHLLNGMLTKAPQKRLTLLDVMTHPWITKNEKHAHAIALSTAHPPTSQISVSSDEIDRAVSGNHIVLLVNIRKQMLKKLKIARERLAIKHSNGAQSVLSPTSSDWDNSAVVFARSPKSKSMAKVNKVHATSSSSGIDMDPTSEKDADRKVLSNEEIGYRSQLFSRKKMSNKNTLDVSMSGGGDNANKSSGSEVAHSHHGSNDGLDDEDALSDEDDELAVSQSPQLLDELLLTTLSMPPLDKIAANPVNTTSLFVSRGEIGSPNQNGSSSASSMGSSASFLNMGRSSGTYDDQRFYGESSALAVHYGVSSLQGRRNTQEDRWVVFPTVGAALDNGSSTPWLSDVAYVGLFDGHGGEECANILHEQLHTWIFRSNEALALTPKDLEERFESLDLSVCDYLLHKDNLSGSTATGVVLRPSVEGKVLLTSAHVGDCRLVLAKRDGRTVELTQDHRLTDDAERNRIIQLGGRVVNNRVNGVMAITRAFGDLEFKGMLERSHGAGNSSGSEHFGGFGRGYREEEKVPALLTAKPDVQDVEIDPTEDEFLILACDGLWDVVTSEEATAIFHDRIKLHGDAQLAAHELAQEGIRRYSSDNITVIAMVLQAP